MTDISDLAQMAEQMRKERRAHAGDPAQMILPSPNNPMAVARVFVERCLLRYGAAGELTLRCWQSGWWAWRVAHWVEVKENAVRALLYAFTEHALYYNADGETMPWLPNRKKIGDLLEALSVPLLLSDEVEQPCWLDGRKDIGSPIVATKNGLLDITTRKLHPHSPQYFNMTSVPFDYDAKAPEPVQWLGFLGELWPQQPEAIDILGEWYGYIVSGRLDLHKILLVIGPTRGGKGVIARILSAMIGRRNVSGPTMSSFGGEFGLQPLIGKSLAVISDARIGKDTGNVVVERLLSISGEDTLTVNIKNKAQWTGKLSVRLTILSNELPRLGDASSAIVGRLVLLLLTRSWLGKEDITLENKLQTELPGILNWALEGLSRLTFDNDNRFTELPDAAEAVTTMRDLASPVSAFIRERCETGGDKQIEVDKLYTAYRRWCEANEHPKPTKQIFGRDLRAVVQSIKVVQSGTEVRVRLYQGITLREPEPAKKPATGDRR